MKHYYSILRRHKRPFRFILGRLLVLSGLCEKFIIPQKGYGIRFYPSNLAEQLWVDRDWREPELRLIRAYLRPGDTVVDVGANVGDTALTASLQVGPGGQVWAVEAHPRTFGFLRGNIALNAATNVRAINAAAAAEAGTLHFTSDRRDDMNRVSRRGIVVAAQRLDDLVPWRGHVDLLKIDVEGYELPVLQGAASLLAQSQCVLIEVAEHHFQQFGYGLSSVLELLKSQGMQLLKPTGPMTAERIDPDYTTDSVENLIAVRDVAVFSGRTGWTIQ